MQSTLVLTTALLLASAGEVFAQTRHLDPGSVILDSSQSWVNESRHEVYLVFRVRSAYRAQISLEQFRRIVGPLAKSAACNIFRAAGREFAYIKNGGTIHVDYRDRANKRLM